MGVGTDGIRCKRNKSLLRKKKGDSCCAHLGRSEQECAVGTGAGCAPDSDPSPVPPTPPPRWAQHLVASALVINNVSTFHWKTLISVKLVHTSSPLHLSPAPLDLITFQAFPSKLEPIIL